MRGENDTYGITAEFADAEPLLKAARRAREAGYTAMDAFSPFPVDGLAEVVGVTKNRVPLATLCGGILGGGFAYFAMWYINTIDYPLNVGGRPFHSWPSFIPITFEVTILFAAVGAVLGMLIFNRLPELYHPVFHAPRFERASQDRFFLVIEQEDPRFDADATRSFLETLSPLNVALITHSGQPYEEETTLDE